MAFAPSPAGGHPLLAIDGESLTVEEVVRVARGGEPVKLSHLATKRVEACHAALLRIVRAGKPVYGVTTGFGQLENVPISKADLLRLQENLVRSHAAGAGPPLHVDDVRASILIRANALAKGYSGVRHEVVDLLLGMLNKGVHPFVPSRGSLGASGDLAPLAHIALVMIGEGEAYVGEKRMPGGAALRAAGLKPLRLEAKEGLAILNGTAVMAGLGCLLVADALGLLKDAEIAASMSFEGLRGSPAPFDARIARLKKQVGQHLVAGNMVKLLQDSEIVQSHKGPHRVQDPYSLRCIPQVLGACFESIQYARQVLEIEINSATDNPLIFPDTAESLSGGNFHGQSLAMALDFLGLGLTVLGAFSERRTARLVDPQLSELPPFLTEHGGLQSGMMILQYTAAALASENKVYAHPASADSIPASANQEDHNSMGQGAAVKARHILENARRIVAIEYLCGAQGLEFRKPLKAGLGPRFAHRLLRKSVPRLTTDRSMSGDIDHVVRMMRAGEISGVVEARVGRLA
ncbi:MAG: histidine ammonia-lyase [Actinobacteria bacterium]|nr:MAG: histidine ammonia-lyase [Actinomycetota bacterium]